jgi:hypothetical protein
MEVAANKYGNGDRHHHHSTKTQFIYEIDRRTKKSSGRFACQSR